MSGRIAYVVGARPNFIKMLPVIQAMRTQGSTRDIIVHTGQHYDKRMSADILSDLTFPRPDIDLGIGSGSHGEQTGRTLMAFERVLTVEGVDLVVVAGDVNATVACALAAVKLKTPVAHVEAGLRSCDWDMPEEVNRVLTDRMSALLFATSQDAVENLSGEGVPLNRVHLVGNTMIDSLRRLLPHAVARAAWRSFGVTKHSYVLATLHRPSNVDDKERLHGIVDGLARLAGTGVKVVFPMHPRTEAALDESGWLERLRTSGVRCCGPLGYLDFLSIEAAAGAILTDSGGVQGIHRPRRVMFYSEDEHGTTHHHHTRDEYSDRRRPACNP